MKRTKIFYRTSARYVEIIDITNALLASELPKHFGPLADKEYRNGPHFVKSYMNTKAIDINTDDGSRLHVKPGDVISKERFSEIVEQMKMAGKRLYDIKASINEEIKSVKI